MILEFVLAAAAFALFAFAPALISSLSFPGVNNSNFGAANEELLKPPATVESGGAELEEASGGLFP